MANEAQFFEANIVNHIINGASVADAAFSVVSDIDNVVDNATTKYLYAKVILTLNDLSAAPAAGKTIDLYRRGLNVLSTLSEPEPDTNYKGTFVGSFLIDAVDPAATDQPYVLMGVPVLPNQMQFYIQNNLGVTISANWDLDVILYTYRAAT
jgi:hypothetical protein